MENEEIKLKKPLDLKSRLNGGSPLTNEKNLVKGTKQLVDNSKTVVKGVTDYIDTKEVQKLLTGNQFQDKIAQILESRAAAKAAKMMGQAGNIASSIGKRIPVLGGLAVGLGTALATGDASAAVPGLNEADAVGPTEGTLEHSLESGNRMTPEEMEILKNRR